MFIARLLLKVSFLFSFYRENLITLAEISYVALLDIFVETTKKSVNCCLLQESTGFSHSRNVSQVEPFALLIFSHYCFLYG